MVAGWLDVPERVDVCVISRVLMILEPDDVADILDYLSQRALTLLICDDIFNFDGDSPIIRTPPEFIIMHDFRRILERAGFEVVELALADIPDRECTGFIVAANRELKRGH